MTKATWRQSASQRQLSLISEYSLYKHDKLTQFGMHLHAFETGIRL